MNKQTLPYWIPTVLFSLAMLGSGSMNLMGAPEVLAGLEHLGYPVYLAKILGTWKLLGVVALLAPGFRRLKEWAYAGFFFNLTGATLSHFASGDAVGQAIAPVIILSIGLLSWSQLHRRFPAAS
mgnify:CR=1 FL=1